MVPSWTTMLGFRLPPMELAPSGHLGIHLRNSSNLIANEGLRLRCRDSRRSRGGRGGVRLERMRSTSSEGVVFFWFGYYCSSFSSAARKGSELKQKDRLDLSPWLAFCLGFVRFFLQLAGLLGFNGLTCAMEEQRRAASHPGGYYGAIMIAARGNAMPLCTHSAGAARAARGRGAKSAYNAGRTSAASP